MDIFQLATNRIKTTFKHEAFWYMLSEVVFWITLAALVVTAYPAVIGPTLLLVEITAMLSLINAFVGYVAYKYRERRSARGIGEDTVNGVLLLIYGMYTLSSVALMFAMVGVAALMILVPV